MSRTDGACFREQLQIPTPTLDGSLLGSRHVAVCCDGCASHPVLECPPGTGVGASG